MLPAVHRLTDPAAFRRITRLGRRAASATLVTHLLVDSEPARGASRAGFVVGRAVGGAVRRNRVRRRLRHAVRDRLDRLPPGAELVVRALPAAAEASYDALTADLDRCLERSLRQVTS